MPRSAPVTGPASGLPAPLWTMAQAGAREHYAPARAAARRGRLRMLFTDAWCRHGRAVLARGPATARALAARWHAELATVPVATLGFGTAWRINRAAHQAGRSARHEAFVAAGRDFATALARRLAARRWDTAGEAFFCYSTAALEALEVLGREGVRTLVDQVDPARAEERLVREEFERWPGWQRACEPVPQAYWERLQAEWEMADAVVVNSTFARDALVAQGVAATKLHVVPLAYELDGGLPPPRRRRAGAPLEVLFLGQVNLRKGVPYLLEAARLLAGQGVRVTIAGPCELAAPRLASAPDNVRLLGPVPRSEVTALYAAADVFVLPTVSDGFALTQLEAMAHGLPVVATPNCGAVVREGVDGHVVGVRDAEALAAALAALAADRDRCLAMGAAASERAARFGLEPVIDALDRIGALLSRSGS